MGDNFPAATVLNIKTILAGYLDFETVEIVSFEQVDPDATIYALKVDNQSLFLLEEDYVSDLESVNIRFEDYGINRFTIVKLKKSRNPQTASRDFNELDWYETDFSPSRLSYPVRYYLAKEHQV